MDTHTTEVQHTFHGRCWDRRGGHVKDELTLDPSTYPGHIIKNNKKHNNYRWQDDTVYQSLK